MTAPSVTGAHLRLEDYFAGHIRAYGLVEDRFGKIRRRFVVDIEGTARDGAFELDERFLFDDGDRSHRIWRIRATGPDQYEGRADDVVGVATGIVSGDTLSWAYRLRLAIGARDMVVGFDDKMILGGDGVLLNVARMHKWGITLGRIVIAFTKQQA